MICLKLATELAVTILSGSEFHQLLTRLLRQFLTRSETTGRLNLANLKIFPRVIKGYSDRVENIDSRSTRPCNDVMLCKL